MDFLLDDDIEFSTLKSIRIALLTVTIDLLMPIMLRNITA